MQTETPEKPKLQNIAVPDPIHRRLKVLAAREGKSIREWITPLLEKLADESDATVSTAETQTQKVA